MTKRFLIIHLPFIPLIFFSALSLKFDQRFEISLREGSPINLQKIFIDNGFPLFNPTTIELIRFENAPRGEALNKESYTSVIDINGVRKSISVNKPLTLERFQLYQMDWRIFIRAINFEINNNLYSLEHLVKNGVEISKNNWFYLVPDKILDNGINYFWEEKNENGRVLQGGFINSNDLKQQENIRLNSGNKIEISLMEEDFGYSSILQVTWKPFRIPLFISGLIFIFSQILAFFPKFVK